MLRYIAFKNKVTNSSAVVDVHTIPILYLSMFAGEEHPAKAQKNIFGQIKLTTRSLINIILKAFLF